MPRGAPRGTSPLANWGNYPRIQSEVVEWSEGPVTGPLIPRGLGRCYGDSALAPRVLSTRGARNILSVDETEGHVVSEAGASLGEVLSVLVPLGWFLPVVPGTKHVTVGGAIASDIHGKNHHQAGTFSRHVAWIDLLTPDGEIRRVAPVESRDLFVATAGGMGLTGIILRAALRIIPIQSAFLRTETLVAKDLEAAMGLFEESARWTYTVAWVDGQPRGPRGGPAIGKSAGSRAGQGQKLGRAIFFRGEHAGAGEVQGGTSETRLATSAPRSEIPIPFHLPSGLLAAPALKVFNDLYFWKHARAPRESLVGYEPFFFPLDRLGNWNRLYGRRGFLQYQFVLPKAESEKGLAAVLERMAQRGLGAHLAVLKLLGEGGDMLSFPMEGYTLALDIPVSPRSFDLLDELDRVVLAHGGRLYLTKDARMPKTMLDEGYPDAAAFRDLRRTIDPEGSLASLQSERLGL